MTPEQLVPTLETCTLLKEKGFDTNTLFAYWRKKPDDEWWIDTWDSLAAEEQQRDVYEIIAAPTLHELLEEFRVKEMYPFLDCSGDFYIFAAQTSEIHDSRHTNPTEAAAKVWLKLHKGKELEALK
jgi:hypothetical protein